MNMKSITRMMLLFVGVAAIALPERTLACEPNGIVAVINAPEVARVGERVFVTVSIRNATDSNFDLRSNLDGNVILNGQLLGSYGYQTLPHPAQLIAGGSLLDVAFEVRKHSDTVVGYGGSGPLVFTQPGAYMVYAGFTRNNFTATLQDLADPNCIIQLVGASTKPINVLKE
jgi:hypothetical protein